MITILEDVPSTTTWSPVFVFTSMGKSFLEWSEFEAIRAGLLMVMEIADTDSGLADAAASALEFLDTDRGKIWEVA